MFSFKVMLISTSVLSAAIMLKFTAPAVADFAVSEVPSIYSGVVSWLRPPYLYLVINFIIITIVASSKLQSNKDKDAIVVDASHLQPLDAIGGHVVQPPFKSVRTDDEYRYNGVVPSDESGVKVGKGLEFDAYEQRVEDASVAESETAPFADVVSASVEDVMSNKENEYVQAAKSTWPEASKGVTEYSPLKPPVSTRFGHRRNGKASPEVLRVAKPKRQDTLESTWKTITEGRAVPLTRHLRKSDTWERDSHVHGVSRHEQQQETSTPPPKTMTKSETFKDRTNTGSPTPGSSGGSGKLKKEPSLSQDELNRRVEAFIKKFNEEMRLQRQESLNQYKEMINRGSH